MKPTYPRALKDDEHTATRAYLSTLMKAEFFRNQRQLKGVGHVPRTQIQRNSSYLQLLPYEIVCTSKRGNPVNYVADEVLEAFHQHLLNIGLYLGRMRKPLLVSPRRFSTARTLYLLTGQILPLCPKAIKRTQRKWEAREIPSP